MAVDQSFSSDDFKVELSPDKAEIWAIFKPTHSTIVFSVIGPGELASDYRIEHTRPGGFGSFDRTQVSEAARERALALATKA
jgi:hypothetical protein